MNEYKVLYTNNYGKIFSKECQTIDEAKRVYQFAINLGNRVQLLKKDQNGRWNETTFEHNQDESRTFLTEQSRD